MVTEKGRFLSFLKTNFLMKKDSFTQQLGLRFEKGLIRKMDEIANWRDTSRNALVSHLVRQAVAIERSKAIHEIFESYYIGEIDDKKYEQITSQKPRKEMQAKRDKTIEEMVVKRANQKREEYISKLGKLQNANVELAIENYNLKKKLKKLKNSKR